MARIPELVSYYDKQLEISIQVPEDWKGQLLEGGQLRILSPEETQCEGYRSTMSFRRELPGGEGSAWFEALIEASRKEMARSYHEYRLRGEDRFTLNSGALGYVRYYSWRDVGNGVGFSQLQALVFQEGEAIFLINAATLETLADLYMPIFDAVLRSMRLIPTA